MAADDRTRLPTTGFRDTVVPAAAATNPARLPLLPPALRSAAAGPATCRDLRPHRPLPAPAPDLPWPLICRAVCCPGPRRGPRSAAGRRARHCAWIRPLSCPHLRIHPAVAPSPAPAAAPAAAPPPPSAAASSGQVYSSTAHSCQRSRYYSVTSRRNIQELNAKVRRAPSPETYRRR